MPRSCPARRGPPSPARELSRAVARNSGDLGLPVASPARNRQRRHGLVHASGWSNVMPPLSIRRSSAAAIAGVGVRRAGGRIAAARPARVRVPQAYRRMSGCLPRPQRQAAIAVEPASVPVRQDPPASTSCSYSVEPTSSTLHWHGAVGDGFETRLTTETRCAWTAAAGAPWIELLTPTSGTGSAPMRVRVGADTKQPTRRAPLEIRWPTSTAGQNVWVTPVVRSVLHPWCGTFNVGSNSGAP